MRYFKSEKKLILIYRISNETKNKTTEGNLCELIANFIACIFFPFSFLTTWKIRKKIIVELCFFSNVLSLLLTFSVAN